MTPKSIYGIDLGDTHPSGWGMPITIYHSGGSSSYTPDYYAPSKYGVSTEEASQTVARVVGCSVSMTNEPISLDDFVQTHIYGGSKTKWSSIVDTVREVVVLIGQTLGVIRKENALESEKNNLV